MPVYSNAQNHRGTKKTLDSVKLMCFYDLLFQPDSTDANSKITEEFLLLIGNNTAYSESTNSYLSRQSISETVASGNIEGFLSDLALGRIPRTRFNTQIYINYPIEKITVIDRIGMDLYSYTQNQNELNWIIHPEKREIKGYTVQKATTTYGGRNWTAWFAPEIPLNFGPHVFQGLPGLIIKVLDTKNHYEFSLRMITNPEIIESIDINTQNVISICKSGFFELRDRLKDNPHGVLMQSIQSSGGSFQFDDETSAQQTINENARRRNNPLELRAD